MTFVEAVEKEIEMFRANQHAAKAFAKDNAHQVLISVIFEDGEMHHHIPSNKDIARAIVQDAYGCIHSPSKKHVVLEEPFITEGDMKL